MPTIHGCFVTGTDTEVGKTRVSAGLLQVLAGQSLRAGGLKPVAAGMAMHDGRVVNEDVALLRAAASVPLSDAEVGAVQLQAACAPHIAAALERRELDRAALLAHVLRLAPRAQAWVVEGVGGFAVPMSAPEAPEPWGMDDFAASLGWPVVLVVGLRLGCLNHALLTAHAIRARGLALAGWVANTVDPAMPYRAENLAMLHARLGAPCLGAVPHLPSPSGAAVAAHLDAPAVLRAFGF